MYVVDDLDEVLPLSGLPVPSTGAPLARVFAGDTDLVLAYEVAPEGEQLAVVIFTQPRAHYFGPPNDEAIQGHPLASRGIGPYGLFEIRHSSWIRTLERMNRVHPSHDASRFAAFRHFVFTFHDKTFECISRGVALAATLPNNEETIARLQLPIAFGGSTPFP